MEKLVEIVVNQSFFNYSICLQHHEVPVVRKCCGKEKILNITKGLACVDGEDGQFETSLAIHFMEKNSLLEFNSSNFYRQYGKILGLSRGPRPAGAK